MASSNAPSSRPYELAGETTSWNFVEEGTSRSELWRVLILSLGFLVNAGHCWVRAVLKAEIYSDSMQRRLNSGMSLKEAIPAVCLVFGT